jgi:hypothetical protein
MKNSLAVRRGVDRAVDRMTWESSRDVCALRDQERHLGHVVKLAERTWAAYDTTKLNLSCSGFLCLGTFTTQAAAKEAVEQSASALGRSVLGLTDLRSMIVAAAVV